MKNTPIKLCALSWALLTPSLTFAQASDDPFAAADSNKQEEDSGEKMIQLVYEVFSMPMDAVAKLQRQGLNDAKLFAEMALKGKQETFMLTRSLPGNKVVNEAVVERIYPTEYEPPAMPNSVGGGLTPKQVAGLQKKTGTVNTVEIAHAAAEVGQFPMTPATPTTFKTRKEGLILEVETNTDGNYSIIDLRISAENTKLLSRDEYGQGVSKTEHPLFSSSRLMTGVALRPGKTMLLGTVTPKSALQPEEGEARVWLAFVTASLVSP